MPGISAGNQLPALKGVVAVGASAGGVEALTRFAAGLPAELPFAVLIVLHVDASSPSVLAQIIDHRGPLRAVWARHGAQLESGTVYVAVPDRHLLVAGNRIMLTEGPAENGHRPAINALFRSVALSWGRRAVGIVLSGVLDDGVLGLAAIRSRGGTTVVQDPADAAFPSLPRTALEAGVVDHQAAAADLGALLARLAARDIEDIEDADIGRDENLELENRIAMGQRFSTGFEADDLGPPPGYTCPDCNGSLVEVSGTNHRCRLGRAGTGDALLRGGDEEVESALWVAIRSLQEKAKLSRQMADTLGAGPLTDHYTAAATEAEQAAAVISRRLSRAYTGESAVEQESHDR